MLVVDGSEIAAHGEGGGALADPHGPTEQLYMQNCVFWGNRVLDGLGGGLSAVDVTMTNATFFDNHAEHSERPVATGLGDAFFCQFGFNSTIVNSIIRGNAVNPVLGSPHVSHSDIEGDPNIVDPNFGPLYFWDDISANIRHDPLFIDTINGDLRVKGFAPVVDAGIGLLAWYALGMPTHIFGGDQQRKVGLAARPNCRQFVGCPTRRRLYC